MRSIKFKGKRLDNKEWVEGFYWASLDPKCKETKWRGYYIHNGCSIENPCEIDPETLCQFTGKTTCKGNEVFENDIVFDEKAGENGDSRSYLVCKWINEWSRFVLLHLYELMDYESGGVKELDNDGTFGMNSIEKLHYAGNYIDNPELMEEGLL